MEIGLILVLCICVLPMALAVGSLIMGLGKKKPGTGREFYRGEGGGR